MKLVACSSRAPLVALGALSLWWSAALPARAQSCTGVQIAGGTSNANIQRALNTHPAGTTFCFAKGTYRIARPLNPKDNQRLIAVKARAATLNGAKVISAFVKSGSNWVAAGNLPQTATADKECIVKGCTIEQDVYLDNLPLTRVLSPSALGLGKFYEKFGANGGQIYLRDNPKGHTVEQAYAPNVIRSTSSGVAVQGFVVEKVASSAQFGAIDAEYSSGPGWTIQNNEVRYSHGVGITSFPHASGIGGSTIAGNDVHHNGQEGIEGYGDNLTVSNNEIAFNNTAGFNPEWESGGAKFGGAPEIQNLLVKGNNVHDNYGPGLWCDINCYNVTFESNTVANNKYNGSGVGIFYEISDLAVIKNNTLSNNGPAAGNNGFYAGADIIISASPHVTVYGNTLSSSVNGIGMLQQVRDDTCSFHGNSTYPDGTQVCPNLGASGPSHQVHDTLIHDNNSTETAGDGLGEIAGLDDDTGVNSSFSGNNLYVHNTYHLPALGNAYFSWSKVKADPPRWQSDGQDLTGTFVSP
jgi:hypothetical protein